MLQSDGVLLKTPSITIWQGRTDQWPAGLDLLGLRWASYGAIYRSHVWVAALVNKIANATARLPLKVYERAGRGRPEASDSAYADLLRRPNSRDDPFLFWLWTSSTLHTYGEAFWGKVRDRGGRPVELVRLHPSSMRDELIDGKVRWTFDNGRLVLRDIPRRDLVQFRFYNPDSDTRGMSPLEPLRSTLENEEGARRANSALYKNGARPSVILRHPRTLSAEAGTRLAAQWAGIHGGADNWAKTAVLEEGMEAQVLSLTSEELQYVESRKLNREEACAIYDVPPPVVHILDHATFSNITEQMRSMYRDTMAPKLKLLESTLEFELRDGRMGTSGEPDFGEGIYAEFLMDEVLRGDFEVRTEAYQKAINAGWMMPAEVREMENRPFIDGSDKLLVNAALVPMREAEKGLSLADVSLALQKIYLAVGSVITAEEARELLNRAGAELTGPAPLDPVSTLAESSVRSVMGRLSRAKTVAALDPAVVTAGLGDAAPVVAAMLARAASDGWEVAELRDAIKALTAEVRHDREVATVGGLD